MSYSKIKAILVISLLGFLVSSCSSGVITLEPDVTKYVLQAGGHRTWVGNVPCPFYVKFDSTIIYDIGEYQNQINKLPGSSSLLIHQNSQRDGFRWKDPYIEIYDYDYVKGERIWQEGDSPKYKAKIGEWVKISYDNCKINTNLHFGGKAPAPHDINIYIK